MNRLKYAGLALSVAIASCSSTEQQPKYPDLHLQLPAEVPEVVRDIGERVLKTTAHKDGQTTNGTGLALDSKWVLTSGHVFAGGIDCKRSSSTRPADPTEAPAQNFGHKIVQAHNGLDAAPSRDAALVGMTEELPNTPPLSGNNLRESDIVPGEPLFMFGYGAHDSSNPYRNEGRRPGADAPRLLGLVAIAGDKDILYAVAGLRDYSTQPDPHNQPSIGDSGGPVVDKQGRLVGVMGQAWEPESKEVFEERISREVTGPYANAQAFALLQLAPVTKDAIAELSATPPVLCTP